MKISLSVKSALLALVFIVSSCATTKYSDDTSMNNYSNLRTGRPYSLKLKDSNKRQKLYFSHATSEEIVGFAGKKDSTIISVSKSNVKEAKDLRKSGLTTAAIGIGAAGAAAIILSSTRATSN